MELHSLSLSLSFACSLSFSTLTFNYDNKRELIIAFDETRAIYVKHARHSCAYCKYINIIIIHHSCAVSEMRGARDGLVKLSGCVCVRSRP